MERGPLPPPLPADRMYSSDKHTGTGITDPRAKDNNAGYAHIWELRQGMPGTEDANYDTAKRSNMSDPGYYSSQGTTGYDRQSSRTSAATLRPRDHVYESPKPARRQDGIYNPNEGGPYYHEFDPNVVDSHDPNIEMSQKRADDVINRNTLDCSLSLHDD